MSSDDEGHRGMGARSQSAMCSSPTSKKALQLKEQSGEVDSEHSLSNIKEALLEHGAEEEEEESEEEDSQIVVCGQDPGSPDAAEKGTSESPNEEGLGGRSRSVPAMTLAPADPVEQLENEWTIWFDKSARKPKAKAIGRADKKGDDTMYEDCIVELGSFSSVDVFWTYWNSLHVHNLKDHCNLRVFKKGIKPLWEDKMNKKGGKWVVRGVPKTHRKKLWTTMILDLIRGKLKDNSTQTVCGVVLSTRDNGDSMQLWQDGGLTLQKFPEAPEETEARLERPDTETVLKQLLFSDCEEPFTVFKYQTHAELQQTGAPPATGQKDKPSYHAARDTLDPSNASAMAVAALSSVPAATSSGDDKPRDGDAQQQLLNEGNPFGMLPGMLLQGSGDNAAMMGMMMGGMSGMMNNPYATTLPGAQGATNAQKAESWAKDANDDLSDSDEDGQAHLVGDQQEVSEAVKQIQERAKLIRTVRKKIRYINFFLARQGKGRELTVQEKQRVKSMPFLQRELQLLEEQQTKEVEEQKRQLGVDSLDFLRKPQQPMTYVNESEKRFKTMRAIRKKIRFIHYHLERQRQGKVLSPAEIAKVNALPEFEKKLAELEKEEAIASAAAGDTGSGSGDADATVTPMPPAVSQAPQAPQGAPLSTTSTPVMQNAPAFPSGSFNAPPLGTPDTAMSGIFPQGSQHGMLHQQPVQPASQQAFGNPQQQNAQVNNWIGGMQAYTPQQQQQQQQQQQYFGGVQAQQRGSAGVSAAALAGAHGLPEGSPQIVELHRQIEAQKKQLEEKERHIEMLLKQGGPSAVAQSGMGNLPMVGGAMGNMGMGFNMSGMAGMSGGLGSMGSFSGVSNGSFLGDNSFNASGSGNPVSPGGLYLSPGPPPLESPGAGTLGQGGPMSPVGGLPPNRGPLAQPSAQQYQHMTHVLSAGGNNTHAM